MSENREWERGNLMPTAAAAVRQAGRREQNKKMSMPAAQDQHTGKRTQCQTVIDTQGRQKEGERDWERQAVLVVLL